MLLSMGCELAQGYQIARPMPAGDVQGWCQQFELEPAWKAQVKSAEMAKKLSN